MKVMFIKLLVFSLLKDWKKSIKMLYSVYKNRLAFDALIVRLFVISFDLFSNSRHIDYSVNVVQWNEDLYEKQLIERTMDACGGQVDIVIDFGTTSRNLHRSMQCLSKGGVVFVIKEVADRLLPKFSRRAEERQQSIKPVEPGTLEQLRELVQLVASGKIEPPPHTVYPAEEALDVVQKLCHSEIQGRAILRFYPAD